MLRETTLAVARREPYRVLRALAIAGGLGSTVAGFVVARVAAFRAHV